MAANPDRVWSSEDIGVAENKCYYIGDEPVITASALGDNIVSSNLTKIGTLTSLSVTGSATFGTIVSAQTISVDSGITIHRKGIDSANRVALTIQDKEIIYGDTTQINIGDSLLQSKPVKVYGKLSVGINNPDPSVNFSVNGDVNIGGKRFSNDTRPPVAGTFAVGDICWNSSPQPHSYIGWVCITEGSPGQWVGFGMIAPV
jgi:hypothetical protein